ncbi:MAG TPA: protein kinase [Fimbriimonadales bacterium]|nr:protein kinase [Fimbriimonadales bacterium]
MNEQFERIGELLVKKGLVTQTTLNAALAEQHNSGKRIGEILIEKGLVTEFQVAQVLAEQYEVPLVDPSSLRPEPAALALLDPKTALTQAVLPYRFSQGELECAIADPLDVEATDHLVQLTRCRLRLFVAPRGALLEAIERAYKVEHVISETPKPPERFTDSVEKGNFSNVFWLDAFDKQLDRPVSLLVTSAKTGEVPHLYSRVRTLSRSHSIQVATVYDWFEERGYAWAVLRRIDGRLLEQIQRENGPRSVAEAAQLIASIAEALGALRVGNEPVSLVCPTNVVINDQKEVSLVPFVKPSDMYKSPEELGGLPADDRSHVFSLGVLLYECLAGVNPFYRGNREEMLDRIFTGKLQTFNSLPNAMQFVLKKCLSPDPTKRFFAPINLAQSLKSYKWLDKSAEATRTVVHTSEDRDELLRAISEPYEERKVPIWKRLFGKKVA